MIKKVTLPSFNVAFFVFHPHFSPISEDLAQQFCGGNTGDGNNICQVGQRSGLKADEHLAPVVQKNGQRFIG